MKSEITYQVIIEVLVFLLELKWWSYHLQLRRLKMLPASRMYSGDCCKTICSSYPKQAALEIQNGTFPGIYKALPWFLLNTINVCWMIFEKCCQKCKLNSSSTYCGTKVKSSHDYCCWRKTHTGVKESVTCLSVRPVS